MGEDIASRMQDYFARQIAWSEATLNALAEVEASEDETAIDRFIAEDAQRARDLEMLEREFGALKKEWEAAVDVPAETREALRGVARRAEALGNEVRGKMSGVLALLRDRAESEEAAVGALRRGRDRARKFGTGEEPSGGFVDRQA